MEDFIVGFFEFFGPSLLCCLPGIGLLIGVGMIVSMNRNVNKHWEAIAPRVGLRYDKGQMFKTLPTMLGSVEGRDVKVWTYTRRSSDTTTRYSAINMSVDNEVMHRFALRPEGVVNKLFKSMGAEDIEIGHPAFDQQFIIKANPPELARHMLADREVREMAAELKRISISFSQNNVGYSQVGLITDADRLLKLLALMAALGERMESAQSTSPSDWAEEGDDIWADPWEQTEKSIWDEDADAEATFYGTDDKAVEYYAAPSDTGATTGSRWPVYLGVGFGLFVLCNMACCMGSVFLPIIQELLN